jgi:putative hydrolase of the HAD superfamily
LPTSIPDGVTSTLGPEPGARSLEPGAWSLELERVCYSRIMPQPRGCTLFIDADDTLWENNIYFDAVVAQYVALVGSHGCPPAHALERLLEIERARTRQYGYGVTNFQSSLEAACRILLDGRDTASEVQTIRELCSGLRRRRADNLPGVTETLRALGGRHRVILLTKGDLDDQLGKVARSGLRSRLHQVDVVVEKDCAAYLDAVERHGADRARTWMIGNSPKSDIVPALEAGLGAVFIPHAATWALELTEIPDRNHARLTIVERFSDLLQHF